MSSPLRGPALKVSALKKSYGPLTAVDDVTLSVAPGEILALLGPNGAGKTTTIACAVGLERPDAGSVRIFGADPVTQGESTRPLVGVMLQDGGLPMGARPLQALRHLARFYRDPLDVDALAERLGITAFSSRTIRRLSGGQRQRVALAAALVGRPALVFLDEPSAGLDPQAQLAVWEVVEELRADGVAMVLTTHTIEDAGRLADQVCIIDHGRVIAEGSPRALVSGQDSPDGAGARSLRIGFPQPVPARVAAELEAAATRRGCSAETTGAGVTIAGPVTLPLVHEATGILVGAGMGADTLSLDHRTLADVFLDLTGRDLR